MTLGTDFAHAVAAKDADRIRSLIDPAIDFRGLTPNRTWEPADPDAFVSMMFENWFEDSDEIEALEHVETDTVVDRERVGYRFRVRNPDGLFLVEQQAYLSGSDGRIEWMRV